MTLASVPVYILLVLGIALLVVGILVLARQLLASDTGRAPAPYLWALVIVIGIASLGISGFLALKKPANTVAAQGQPSPPAAATQAASTPAAPASPAVPTTASSSPAPTGAVTLTAPASGSNVQQCDIFTGTSDLPAAETIVIGVRNLNDSGNTSYLAPVHHWDKPGSLAQWTGAQYFGSGDSSLGQTYQVSVIVMATSVVQSALADPANHTAWAVTSLPAGSTVKQTLHLTRVSGQGPAGCS